jgi:hypothetical protein
LLWNHAWKLEDKPQQHLDKGYKLAGILSDGGFGIDIFIPKTAGIDAELLAMCAMYAVPAEPESVPGEHHE